MGSGWKDRVSAALVSAHPSWLVFPRSFWSSSRAYFSEYNSEQVASRWKLSGACKARASILHSPALSRESSLSGSARYSGLIPVVVGEWWPQKQGPHPDSGASEGDLIWKNGSFLM